jgi:uncharacterized protein YpmS
MINQNKRKTGFLLIALAIILLVLAVLFLLNPKKNIFKNIFNRDSEVGQEEKSPEQIFEEERAKERDSIVYDFDPDVEANREWDEDDFRQIARPFAERFGSYSNQSDYRNIDDLKIFMTEKMKDWADDYVRGLRESSPIEQEFYGVTTKSLLEPQILSFDLAGSKVEVSLTVQREEIFFSGEKNIFSQDIKIVFVKQNGEWLVDGAFWQ